MILNRPEGAVDVNITEARIPPEMHEHSVSPNVNHAKVVTTDADSSLTAKMASENKEEDYSGRSAEKEPTKTEPHQRPSSSVKNEGAPVKEGKTVTLDGASEGAPVKEGKTATRKGAGAANLTKASTKVDICKYTLENGAINYIPISSVTTNIDFYLHRLTASTVYYLFFLSSERSTLATVITIS